MLKISLLTVEDENGAEIDERVRRGLEEWLFVRKGLVDLHQLPEEERWVTNLADWRRAVDRLVDEYDLVFCTVDLSIPEDRDDSRPDPRHGITIVHEITARRREGLRCCVLTGLDNTEIERHLGDSVPDVLFDFKTKGLAPYRNVVNDVKSQVLANLEALSFVDSQGQRRDLLLNDASGKLREHYLSRVPYYVDQPTWHVPTLILGPPGLGRRSLVEFTAHLAEAELEVIDLAPSSFAANRRAFETLERLAVEIERAQDRGTDATTGGRKLCYVADLDRYVPGVSGDEGENCLWPLGRILERISSLGSTRRDGFPLGFVFSASGASRLRIRSAETRLFIEALEDTIGLTTDFPLHHLASDVNGWPRDHPRIVALPGVRESGRHFVHDLTQVRLDVLRELLPERLPNYRGETLTLADDVLDFLADKTDWSHHGNFGGLVAAFDAAFEEFLQHRSRHQYQITRAHLDESLRKRMARTVLNVDDVALEFPTPRGGTLSVVRRADFHVEDGELLAIVGPSGCGKSSILRMLAGLQAPSAGTLSYRGELIARPSSKIGFIFQDYSLFPWLTVRGNIEFGPRLRGERAAAVSARLEDLLEVAQLKGFEDSWPRQLSGGMQQRVAIVRALANEPDVLLMDEPFGALDVQTRWRMQDFLVQTKALTHKTIVFVTHDIDEAVYIADRIYVASPRPLTIRDEVIVPFALEDRNDALRIDAVFAALVGRVRETLLEEVAPKANGGKST